MKTLAPDQKLVPNHIAEDEVGDYNVTEAGWYALDDGEHVVLGPFASLAECERNIRDHERTQQLEG